MFRHLAILLLATVLSAHAQDLAGDLTLHRLLIDGENWQLVADGIGFADGACADAAGNFYFSDLRGNAIYKVAPDGQPEKIFDEAASGLKFGPDGRLFACQGAKKRIVALDLASKAIEVLAEGVTPNDLVVTQRGHLYATLTRTQQVLLFDLKTKTRRVVDHGITTPNGLTLSPDQGTLAVSDYRGENVWVFRIEPDGTLSAKAPCMAMRLPIDSKGQFRFHHPPPYLKESGGGGMTSDTIGRYYVTTTLGVQVFDPTGRFCGLLTNAHPGHAPTNCVLAGTGRAWLYVTQHDKVFRRKVQANGNVFEAAPAP
ncbi:MAG TPA: SMP-30/gluconolactonase/LRE family protein [Chthoniobacteraceae bacterium]|jgi:enterochelin esterase family protein|nr:SMP-30/gluconolactonase/LRE family protein [Chthoniobacteraceae bacterium]